MVEAAIGAIVTFGLLFGVFQFAMLSAAYLAARNGASNGAREGAVAGNDPAADFYILEGIKKGATLGSNKQIQRIVVFKASGPGGSVPPACLTGASSTTDLCNVYSAGDLQKPVTDFGDAGWPNDDGWPGGDRVVSRGTGTDWLGVYVEEKALNMGGTLVFTRSFRETAIVRIEATAG